MVPAMAIHVLFDMTLSEGDRFLMSVVYVLQDSERHGNHCQS